MKNQLKSTLLTLLMVGFVALITTGCGNSREDFVVTNNNNNFNNGANTGNLVFRFQQVAPQAIGQVPNGTTTLRFDLHSGNPPTAQNLIETRTVAFATVITLEDVPDNVVFTRVTAFGADGAPSVFLDATNIDVDAGGSAEVTFTGSTNVTLDAVTFSPDPANLILYNRGRVESNPLAASLAFSNGSLIDGVVSNTTTTCVFADTSVGSFDGTNLVPAFIRPDGQNTTALCSYTFGSTTLNDTIAVSKFGYFPFSNNQAAVTPEGDFTGTYFVEFYDDNNTGFVNVNQTAGTTYSFGTPAPSGLTINSTNGQLTSTGSTTADFDVVVTWVDQRAAADGGTGLTFSDTVPFSVITN